MVINAFFMDIKSTCFNLIAAIQPRAAKLPNIPTFRLGRDSEFTCNTVTLRDLAAEYLELQDKLQQSLKALGITI